MKIETFTFIKHKFHLFSCVAIMLASILFSASKAYSQVDYYYGINNKGFRIGVGAGGASLKSNWSENKVEPIGVASVDYDFNQFVGVGVQTQFGSLQGVDPDAKFHYEKTTLSYAGYNFNFHVAVGQFLGGDKKPKTLFIDVLQKIYLGVGAGIVQTSNIKLYDRYDGKIVNNLYSKTQTTSSSYTYFPINLGTRIPLRGLLGNDRIDLNPNFQYNFIQSPLFDGFQPSTKDDPTMYIKKNGNQAFADFTLSIRYKF